jgi:hypothetical protein
MESSKSRKRTDPPLVDLKVTNPVTYIRNWWNKVIGNEGIDFRFHIKPLTALALAIVVASIGFGVGRFVIPFKIPFFQYNNFSSPVPTAPPSLWKETAFIGTLQFSTATNKYFLQTSSSSEAISLEIPNSMNLESVIGKRIFAIGDYNKSIKVLKVDDYKNLEVLSKSPIPIPTNTPTPQPTPIPTVEPIESPQELSTPIQ